MLPFYFYRSGFYASIITGLVLVITGMMAIIKRHKKYQYISAKRMEDEERAAIIVTKDERKESYISFAIIIIGAFFVLGFFVIVFA